MRLFILRKVDDKAGLGQGGRVICELDFFLRICVDGDCDEREKEGTDVHGIHQEDAERHES